MQNVCKSQLTALFQFPNSCESKHGVHVENEFENKGNLIISCKSGVRTHAGLHEHTHRQQDEGNDCSRLLSACETTREYCAWFGASHSALQALSNVVQLQSTPRIE